MYNIPIVTIIWLGLSVLMTSPVSAKIFHFASDEWYPFYFTKDNKPTGLAYDIMKEAMLHLGHSFSMKTVPTRRLRVLMERGIVDGMLLDSPEWAEANQISYSVFSKPVLQVSEYVYAPIGSPFKPHKIEDFKGKKIAISAGYMYPAFEQLKKNDEIKIFEAYDPESLPLMASANRVDLFFMDEISFQHLKKMGKIEEQKFKPIFKINTTTLSFRLHKKNMDLLPSLNKTLDEMRKNRAIQDIEFRYLAK